jgi:hypothetical protein
VRQSRPHDEVEQEGRSEGGSDASASDGKTRCGRKRAGADWYGPMDDDNILLFLVVGFVKKIDLIVYLMILILYHKY